jgi:peptide/nickel transport system substrate-binding protein
MHDGNVLSAEDVRYSIERFRKFSIGAAQLEMVKTLEVMPGNKLKLSMDAPFSPLLPTLAYNTIGIYSKAAAEKAGDEDFGKAPVGPGPYRFAEQKKGESVRLEAFDDYWAGKPKLKTLIVRAIPEMGARTLALESGDVDLIFNVGPQDAQRLGQNPQLTVLTPPSARLDRLSFNVTKPPVDNKLVRQAIAYGIDRDAIVKSIFLGMATVSHSPGPEGAFGYTGDYDVYRYNPGKARELLAQAGLPNGLSLKFHFSPGRYLLDQNVVEAMKAQLAQVGVRMEVTSMEWGAFSDFIALPIDQNQTVAIWYGWRSVNGDVDSAISDMHSRFFRPKGNNSSFFKNDEYDRLVDQEQSEPDANKRAELLKRMQQILMDDLPFLPLYNEPQIWAAKKNLEDIQINPLTCLEALHLAEFR